VRKSCETFAIRSAAAHPLPEVADLMLIASDIIRKAIRQRTDLIPRCGVSRRPERGRGQRHRPRVHPMIELSEPPCQRGKSTPAISNVPASTRASAAAAVRSV